MKIEGLCADLSFQEYTHTYRCDNAILPSVTQIMKPLSTAIYKGVNDDVLRMAADRGTMVHEAFELFADFGYEDISEGLEGYLEALKKFFKNYRVVPVATEQRFYHKLYRYAGTADLIAEIDGQMVLVDYKTTAQVQTVLTTVQLVAYRKALESQGIKIDYTAILHVGKDGEYKFVRQSNEQEGWDTFLGLLKVNQYLRKYAA